MSLDETLYALLFRRSSREAFLRGELVLARDEAEALSAIDGGQLERVRIPSQDRRDARSS